MICRNCSEDKNYSEFYGYNHICKKCYNSRTRDWHKKNPEKNYGYIKKSRLNKFEESIKSFQSILNDLSKDQQFKLYCLVKFSRNAKKSLLKAYEGGENDNIR